MTRSRCVSFQKMQTPLRPGQWLALMLLLVFSTSRGQQNESRRAVAEHQLMHDRGRNIQSLKRLIWLSGAMEGLHGADARSAEFNPTKALNAALVPAAGNQPSRVHSLLRDFFHPALTQQQDREA
ncbi:parathyroid hormone 4 [Pseudoliparis swirei]|uniref:parathyroid hormone 4 n=1 Tax=Pseudoliparis swirei TaxID=2059687 RepID=UPI0024BE252B|nr:parathyroid hormone 4 [Pseudoliparis swirei]